MPVLQMAGHKENEECECCGGTCNITDHHHQLAVVAIHHDAGNRRHDQEGRDIRNLYEGHRRSGVGLLIHVDGHCESRHSARQNRDDLPDPHQGETQHPAKAMLCPSLYLHE